ncbi:MAG: protein-glutamate O-methyltransferase [Granulosicoccus sp.]|nr:protein-glutamate O-methyltransferase [Granulosicoccus sp.]
MSQPRRQLPTSLTEDEIATSMSDEIFSGFQRITLEQTGIELSEGKRAMIVNRFTRRLMALGLTCFEEYLELVADPANREAREFIDTVTTNLTYFFREAYHFKVLSDMVLPELARRIETSVPIRIWSSACSSGQEPYSLAITVKETEAISNHQVRILCTDIDTKMIAHAQAGKYSQEQLRGLNKSRQDRWFNSQHNGYYTADDALRSMLVCKRLNLFDRWPIREGVDVIVCRNVLIYFNLSYQQKLLRRFAEIQTPGAYLFLGHSETLDGFDHAYRRVDNTVYERI